MSITADFDADAKAAVKAQLASAKMRWVQAHRVKRGVSDPEVLDEYHQEFAKTKCARNIIFALADGPDLSVQRRVELIALLMPSDAATAENVMRLLRSVHADTA